MFESVCQQIAIWKNSLTFPYRISINVSPAQLIGGNLLEIISAAVKKYDIALSSIEFEITEMAAMQENGEAATTIRSLCQLGATHTVDNFGAGFSSIKHLRFLPVSTIKIDQSFVQGLGKQKMDEDIVSSIIMLAKKMGLKVVAEGVEEQEQLTVLQREHCDYAQGYLFSKPLSIEQATKLMQSEGA